MQRQNSSFSKLKFWKHGEQTDLCTAEKKNKLKFDSTHQSRYTWDGPTYPPLFAVPKDGRKERQNYKSFGNI